MSTLTRDALHVLRDTRPAERWTDAFPVGNGVRGAMCEGRVAGERLWLNDLTAWSGSSASDPLAGIAEPGPAVLDAAHDALSRGDIAEAERLTLQQQTPWAQAYLPLARLDIDVLDVQADTASLRRELDLTTAIATHEYVTGEGAIRHDTWADAATGAIVHRVTADTPVRLKATLISQLRTRRIDADGGVLAVEWHLPIDVAPEHAHQSDPVRYDFERGRHGAVTVRSSSATTIVDGVMTTAPAREHLLVVGTATAPPLPGEPDDTRDAITRARTEISAHDDPDALRTAHLQAHQELYARCTLDLPSAPDAVALSTVERIARAQERPDEGLAALAFHYGRYLLISSSRKGSLPLTLQGMWNAELPGPWSSAYTTNINLQMAYWPAETTSLPECHEPLLRFVRRVSETTGRTVARVLHGTEGWAMYHNSDVWGHAAPVGDGVGDPAWAFWPFGGVWLSTHLWEAYAFDRDTERLRTDVWPVLEATARFALSWIRTDGTRAWTSPSTSPENRYLDAAGVSRAVGESSTMDVALLRELSAVCGRAAEALDVSPAWVADLAALTALLPSPRVSPDGDIPEWDADMPDAEPDHRHLSHLVGLFPFAQITPERTPELAAAAAASILGRGPESTGWALAWRMAMWARLGDGAQVHDQLSRSLRPAADDAGAHRGGLYANMFSAHPPFQIDGNLGVTAGIAEALMQSHDEMPDAGTTRIRLLPALPEPWSDGAVTGLRARGAVAVDVEWSQHLVTQVRLRSDGPLTVVVSGPGLQETRATLQPRELMIIEPKEPQW